MMDSQPVDPEALAPVATDGMADVGDVQLLGIRVCLFFFGEDWSLMSFLARMGYKQELRRQYSTTQVFAIAFSIMGLVPSNRVDALVLSPRGSGRDGLGRG